MPLILISLYVKALWFMMTCIAMQIQYFIPLVYELHVIYCLIKSLIYSKLMLWFEKGKHRALACSTFHWGTCISTHWAVKLTPSIVSFQIQIELSEGHQHS